MGEGIFGECEGSCSTDDDCKGDLKCFHRDYKSQNVPGCLPGAGRDIEDGANFCYDPKILNDKGGDPRLPLNECEGDCDSDDDCAEGLKCYQRHSADDPVPGCYNNPTAKKTEWVSDFCFNPDHCCITQTFHGMTWTWCNPNCGAGSLSASNFTFMSHELSVAAVVLALVGVIFVVLRLFLRGGKVDGGIEYDVI